MEDDESKPPTLKDLWAAHPGARSWDDADVWLDAIGAGWRPDRVLAECRAYARLVKSQDIQPLSVGEWIRSRLADH